VVGSGVRQALHAGVTGLLLLALATGSQYVQATYGEGGAQPPPVRAKDAPEKDRERLKRVDGIPVLRLSGSRYEVGRQHGALLKRQIEFIHKEYFEAMVVPAVGRGALDEWATEVEPHIPAALKEEMRGIADGSGMAYRKVLLANTMLDRLQSVMCSTVAASGDATIDGEVYFGRNLDFPGRNILHRMTVVIVFEPDGETPLAAVTWPGLVGVLSGMNAHGVAGATMLIHRGKPIQPGLPYLLMYRQALQAARKTPDVAASIRKAKRTCPNNFMVVDADGTAAVLEFDQTDFASRAPEGGTLCSTNHFRSEKMKDVGWPVGTSRYRTLANFVAREHGSIDLARIKKALSDTATPWFLNVQSMVFMPKKRALHLSVGGKLPAAGQRFAHLDREALFGKAR